MSNGHNPMRWDCDRRGCFNKKRRPKIEDFHDLFPGLISFGDVDAIVEMFGHALMLEWKSDAVGPNKAQAIMYHALTTYSRITVLIVIGDAETMDVREVGSYFNGHYNSPEPCDMAGLREQIAGWVEYAKKTRIKPASNVRREA